LDRQGAQDTMLLMARGDNQELGAIRVDAQLRVRVSRLGNRETTSTRITPGRWYHVDMTLDIAKRTFSMQLSDAAGKRLLRRASQAWRAAGVTSVDGVCVAPSVGTRGAGLSFDEVRVTRRP